MFICTKTQFLEEMWWNVNLRFARPNLAEVEQFVPSMKTVAHGSVTVLQDLREPCVNDLSVQQTPANMVELV